MEISRNTMEVAAAATTALVGAVVCYGSLENGIAWGESGPQPGYFPFCIGSLIVAGSLANIVYTLWKGAARASAVGPAGEAAGVVAAEPFIDGTRLRQLAAFFLPILAMVVISAGLGLYIGMALYIFYAMRVSVGYRTITSLLISAAVVLINFFIFETVFLVPLLKGPILEYFGIY
ncbi:tripartite tricarboxylate transporter TctB family protein [Ancylobacter sp. A5.8]|uniref:tripartite tricarboxylate transporter TctB family protein n=1 Tax=Ancylobacter gelatini TaxID=2919920 RepID=UPI001F4E1897|nr:tripartite tricarboxylate transporter TctB family protein [Ancylobacter gelatini]MCJ8142199.1 tripartite tricarboxylate transporter TctB family protein [Ancylobacter gelatini]